MILTSFLRVWLTRSLKHFEFQNVNEDLDFQSVEKLGLYVHIPFCKKLCGFCPYCKFIYQKEIAKQYKSALLNEITLITCSLKEKKEVTSLYFGGGTPALMINDIKDIINHIEKYFIIRDGIGVELHPDDVCEENLLKLKDAGVTMISIGIQSFNSHSLCSLGRNMPDYNKIFGAINLVKFDVIDMDLIFGIPGQSSDILINDIKIAFENGATQISTYPFIDFTYANNSDVPLAQKEKKKMLKEITRFTERCSYIRTSVWTFAKQQTGKYSSVTRDNFLGFGVSSSTLLMDQFKVNTFSLNGYFQRIEQNKLPTSLTLKFSIRQRMVYYLFWSAYSMHIDSQKFEAFFNKSLTGIFGFELWVCTLLGFINKDSYKYHLTARGAYYYHRIEQIYTTAYIDRMWNISGKTAFPDKIILR